MHRGRPTWANTGAGRSNRFRASEVWLDGRFPRPGLTGVAGRELLMPSPSCLIIRLVGFLLAISAIVFAQSGTTSLRGTVTDPSLAVVSGANVNLANPERGFTRTVTTGYSGNYEFLQLQPGVYQLTVAVAGF